MSRRRVVWSRVAVLVEFYYSFSPERDVISVSNSTRVSGSEGN